MIHSVVSVNVSQPEQIMKDKHVVLMVLQMY